MLWKFRSRGPRGVEFEVLEAADLPQAEAVGKTVDEATAAALPGPPSLRAAFEAAKRGERWD